MKRKSQLEDLAGFFRPNAVWESIEGRAFVSFTAAAILVVFRGVFYLTDSYLLAAPAACVPPAAYIWWLMRTIGHDRRRTPSVNGRTK